MSFRTHAIKINGDKLLTIVVAITIITYLIISGIRQFDFSEFKSIFKNVNSALEFNQIYEYVNNHPNYYYRIEESTYCITKEELIESKEIDSKVTDKMQSNMVEVTYIDGDFHIKYNDECIEGS